MMRTDVQIEMLPDVVRKYNDTPKGLDRVRREREKLEAVSASPHVPHILNVTETETSMALELERIDGEDTKQWLAFNPDWTAQNLSWADARQRLGWYVTAEMDLLNRGAMYRDLNLEHLIFTTDKAVLIDHEASVLADKGLDSNWRLDDHRGTWETMAPEEFPGSGILTSRTATYRVAIVAHFALTGKIPVKRFPKRKDVYAWRRRHAPEVAYELPVAAQRVFRSALARKPAHRHKDPARFFAALTKCFEPIE